MREILAEQLSEVEFFYDIKHPKVNKGNSFKFYKIGTLGVGDSGVPFFSFDPYIDKSEFNSIYDELEENVPKFKSNWVSMIPKGIVPSILNAEPSLDSLMANLDLFAVRIPEHLQSLVRIREYVHEAFGLTKGWRSTLQLRNTSNFKNKCLPTEWKDFSNSFPKLKNFIESLPLKSLGYVNIMMYERGKALPIHRDTYHAPHCEHFININFHRKPKPTFMYDEMLDKKVYLPENVQCYFFNECDLHGVDATEEDYFTVRVDCQLEDRFNDIIKMKDGKVFDWSYPKASQFVKDKSIYVVDPTRI